MVPCFHKTRRGLTPLSLHFPHFYTFLNDFFISFWLEVCYTENAYMKKEKVEDSL